MKLIRATCRTKRDPLARVQSKCSGTYATAHALSCAALGCSEHAGRSESTYAQLVDMMSRIVAHNRLLEVSLENAICLRGTNRAKLNACVAWRRNSGLFSRFSLVFCIHKVGRHQIRLIRARCCLQSGPSSRAKRCSVWPK